ncbi:MAG: hypothetical protein IPM60_05340 [Rhodospirillales bacterium]|nr:hypothetical protein [Rhodospirillales bacterium]
MVSTHFGEHYPAGEHHPAGEQRPVARACSRLAVAVARLEEAVEAALGNGGGARDDADLQAAREEAMSLRAAHQAVSERLDSAIERLRALLNE